MTTRYYIIISLVMTSLISYEFDLKVIIKVTKIFDVKFMEEILRGDFVSQKYTQCNGDNLS